MQKALFPVIALSADLSELIQQQPAATEKYLTAIQSEPLLELPAAAEISADLSVI